MNGELLPQARIVSVKSPQLPEPNGHFSQAVIATGSRTLFISGMTSRARDGSVVGVGDVRAQAEQVYENIRHVLGEAGGSLADVCRLDVFVRNIEDFAVIHEVRARYFTGVPPASTMLEVSKFVNKDYLIEVNAVAMLA